MPSRWRRHWTPRSMCVRVTRPIFRSRRCTPATRLTGACACAVPLRARPPSCRSCSRLSQIAAPSRQMACGSWLSCRPSSPPSPPPRAPAGPEQARVITLSGTADAVTDSSSTAALVLGLSRYSPLDDQYRGFCRLVADQVSATMANATAYQGERRRAESLAQLDQAKTTFLANVSHEFRTPLTLMLGPLDDALASLSGDDALADRL